MTSLVWPEDEKGYKYSLMEKGSNDINYILKLTLNIYHYILRSKLKFHFIKENSYSILKLSEFHCLLVELTQLWVKHA